MQVRPIKENNKHNWRSMLHLSVIFYVLTACKYQNHILRRNKI